MTDPEISRLRLRNQRLDRPTFSKPDEVVGWLCAVQSQDYAAAKWALGTRMRAATDADVERAFDAGTILRTHVLRPTWHFVLPADIRWLLTLTAPRIRAGLASRHRQLGLDSRTLKRSNAALERVLRNGANLTRNELRDALDRAGIQAVGTRMAHIMAWAELNEIVCSGPSRGRQFTYALLDAQAPAGPSLTRDEALAALARRYFPSRGPATVHDFAKWAGLTLADARGGLKAVEGELRRDVVDGRTHWSSGVVRRRVASAPAGPAPGQAHLLSLFDEYISSYQDRSAIVAPEHARTLWPMGNAVTHVIVFDGKIVGTWSRRLAAKAVEVAPRFFERPRNAAKREVAAAARRYAAFLGLPLTLVPVP
ncbi:winged helix DNA-binding domain-containing protein [soil metagenome]